MAAKAHASAKICCSARCCRAQVVTLVRIPFFAGAGRVGAAVDQEIQKIKRKRHDVTILKVFDGASSIC